MIETVCASWVAALGQCVAAIMSIIAVVVATFYSKRDQRIDLIQSRVSQIDFWQRLIPIFEAAARDAIVLDNNSDKKLCGLEYAKILYRKLDDCAESLGIMWTRFENLNDPENRNAALKNFVNLKDRVCCIGYYFSDDQIVNCGEIVGKILDMIPSFFYTDILNEDADEKEMRLATYSKNLCDIGIDAVSRMKIATRL